ncbi:MAG TPA: hypothetical protein K8V27_08405, partial [Butyricicoccus pullicaecorum]|nr:hypothetical protein [Butyricicoccus pullicaecorum]
VVKERIHKNASRLEISYHIQKNCVLALSAGIAILVSGIESIPDIFMKARGLTHANFHCI